MLMSILRSLLILSAVSVGVTAGGWPIQHRETDVVIIGGGSSGTYAATRLTRMGHDVVVIEKSDHLGGHANTYVDPASGTPINVGVQVFENDSIVLAHFADLGVPVFPVPNTNQPVVNLDFTRGAAVPNYTPLTGEQIGTALSAYATILATNYLYLVDGFNLPDPVPHELLQPFGEFAEKHGLQDMVFVCSTYEQPEETWKQPTLYVFVNLRASLVEAIIGPSSLATTTDVNALYRSAAELLGSKVIYNSTAAKVRRSENGVIVTANSPTGKIRIKAKKLLFATYPVLENLAGWDLRPEDLEVFAKFRPKSYFDGVISSPGLNGSLAYQNIGTHTPFNIPRLPGVLSLGPTGFSDGSHLAYVGSNTVISRDRGKALPVDQLDTLSKNGLVGGGDVTFKAWWDHTPFKLQVSAEDIAAGFYRDLYGLQGVKSTYWTGATFQAQDSSMVWAYTESLLANLTA